MKKTIVKSVLAATMLFSMVLGHGEGAVAATTSSTKAPVMMDNLSKYGLKKDVELPVTVTAGGLSYTLHKIMIYDINSKDAKALMKKYGYTSEGDFYPNAKYFIWTKITIQNNSKKVVQRTASDVSYKWTLSVKDSGMLEPRMPFLLADDRNSTNALWSFKLDPGKKLTTYEGFTYDGDLKYFVIRLFYQGAFAEKFVVSPLNK